MRFTLPDLVTALGALALAPSPVPAQDVTSTATVVVVGDPAEPELHALAALIATRFDEVEVRATRPQHAFGEVVVFAGGGERAVLPPPDRWRPHGRPDAEHWNSPTLFVGAQARAASERWELVGGEQAHVASPVELRLPAVLGPDDPGPEGAVADDARAAAAQRLDPLPARAPGSFTPLSFALEGCPEVCVLAEAQDARGRPVAVAWHQGRFVSFGPAAPVDTLDPAWRAALLDLVELTATFGDYADGLPVVPRAPGLGALEAVTHELTSDAPDRAFLAARLDPRCFDVRNLDLVRAELARVADALTIDAEGRVTVSPDLRTAALGPLDDRIWLRRAVDDLERRSSEVRDRARRLLAAHVPDGPHGASAAEWRAWLAAWGRNLVFARADRRWHTDRSARHRTELDPDVDATTLSPLARALERTPRDIDRDLVVARIVERLGTAETLEQRTDARIDLARHDPEQLGLLAETLEAGVRAADERRTAALTVATRGPEPLRAQVAGWLGPTVSDRDGPGPDGPDPERAERRARAAFALDALATWPGLGLRPDVRAALLARLADDFGGDPGLTLRALHVLPHAGPEGVAHSAARLTGDASAGPRGASATGTRTTGREGDAARWATWTLCFELGDPTFDRGPARPALRRLSGSDDPWTRWLATWALGRGELEEADRALLTRLAADEADPLRAELARHLAFRADPPPGWRVERYLASGDGPGRALGRTALGAENPTDRFDAARALARTEGQALLAAAGAGDSEARRTLERVEYELAAWVDALCLELDDEIGWMPAGRTLADLGATAIPELEQEFVRPYRFPIGPASYEELFGVAVEIGPEAWPLALGAFHHWRRHGLWNARALFGELGARRELLAPFAALAFARDAAQRVRFDVAEGGSGFEDRRFWFEYGRSWVQVWRGLGDAGAPALARLATHPDPRVREAVSVVQTALDAGEDPATGARADD